MSHARRSLIHALSLTALIVAPSGCGDEAPAPAPRGTEHAAARAGQDAAAFAWPRTPQGTLRQVGKYEDELAELPELYPIQSFPGGVMPAADIACDTPQGRWTVHCVGADEAARLVAADGFVMVDVRKDGDVAETGIIPGALHLEYRHEGFEGYGSTRLTAEVARDLLASHRGLIFHCNGEKCPRSFNACIAAVQLWGIQAVQVRWFRDGLPDWIRSPLIPDPLLGTILK